MEQQEQNLIRLLRLALTGDGQPPEEPDNAALVALAQRHQVSNLLYMGFRALPEAQRPEARWEQAMKQAAFLATAREAVQQQEMEVLLPALHTAGLRALPLKGYYLKRLYPRPELRFMSDIDLLIGPEQAEKVRACLEQQGFRCDRFGNGDVDLYSGPTGMRYELHRSLTGEAFNEEGERFLASLWEYVEDPAAVSPALIPEAHYAYVLLHLIKHLVDGGAGIRAVMDVWACRRGWPMDSRRLEGLLERLKLRRFAGAVEALAEAWFGDGESGPLEEELGSYLLGSGAFGTDAQRVTDRMLRQEGDGGRVRYLFRRLFPPFSLMSFYFPVLKRVPVLLPFFWLWRMARALLFRRRKLGEELSAFGDAGPEAVRSRAGFYRRCGLDVDDLKGR